MAFTYAEGIITLTRDRTLEAAITPTVTAGQATRFSISPALPPGLLFDGITASVSGTPLVLLSPTAFIVEAQNEGGKTSATFSLAVIEPPPDLFYGEDAYVFIQGETSSTFAPLNAGGPFRTCDISPTLPSGLQLNARTCEVFGIPTQLSDATDYTVQVKPEQEDAPVATVTLNIQVSPELAIYPPHVTTSGRAGSTVRFGAVGGDPGADGYFYQIESGPGTLSERTFTSEATAEPTIIAVFDRAGHRANAVVEPNVQWVNGEVVALASGDSRLYVGGNFNRAQFNAGAGLSVIDASGNPHLEFDVAAGFDQPAQDLLIEGDSLYAIGRFRSYHGQQVNGLAKIDIRSGQLDPEFDSSTPLELSLQRNHFAIVGPALVVSGIKSFDGVGSTSDYVVLDKITGGRRDTWRLDTLDPDSGLGFATSFAATEDKLFLTTRGDCMVALAVDSTVPIRTVDNTCPLGVGTLVLRREGNDIFVHTRNSATILRYTIEPFNLAETITLPELAPSSLLDAWPDADGLWVVGLSVDDNTIARLLHIQGNARDSVDLGSFENSSSALVRSTSTEVVIVGIEDFLTTVDKETLSVTVSSQPAFVVPKGKGFEPNDMETQADTIYVAGNQQGYGGSFNDGLIAIDLATSNLDEEFVPELPVQHTITALQFGQQGDTDSGCDNVGPSGTPCLLVAGYYEDPVSGTQGLVRFLDHETGDIARRVVDDEGGTASIPGVINTVLMRTSSVTIGGNFASVTASNGTSLVTRQHKSLTRLNPRDHQPAWLDYPDTHDDIGVLEDASPGTVLGIVRVAADRALVYGRFDTLRDDTGDKTTSSLGSTRMYPVAFQPATQGQAWVVPATTFDTNTGIKTVSAYADVDGNEVFAGDFRAITPTQVSAPGFYQSMLAFEQPIEVGLGKSFVYLAPYFFVGGDFLSFSGRAVNGLVRLTSVEMVGIVERPPVLDWKVEGSVSTMAPVSGLLAVGGRISGYQDRAAAGLVILDPVSANRAY